MTMEKPPIHNATADCRPLTTFVHTNTTAFREVVQRLTGPSETSASKEGETTKVAATVKRSTSTSKLHERRKYMKPKLEIVKPTFHYKSACASPSNKSRSSSFPASPVSGSSSLLPSPTTPSAMFSQLTIVEDEKKDEMAEINIEEEEKAIKEKRFYLHPSPRSKAGFSEPELLVLFPLASPDASEKV